MKSTVGGNKKKNVGGKLFHKKPLVMLLCMVVASGMIAGCNSEDKSATDIVVDEFMQLAEIPRGSHNEQAVSDYLKSWAEEKGLSVVQDSVNNIIIDKPGTVGYEDAPLTIMQGHMDMVIVSDPDKDFDGKTDPITVINDGTTLTADGTSLGADDGIGISTVLYILESDDIVHGPIRAIFTVDEEDGMYGAENLDASYLDAKYLINLDWETYGSLCNSCAGSRSYDISREPVFISVPEGMKAYDISLTGLLGGHSGVDIDKGRANAIIELANVIEDEFAGKASCCIADFTGGSARNAIPADASMKVLVAEDNASTFETIFNEAKEKFADEYGAVETSYSFELTEASELPQTIMGQSETINLCNFITTIPNGVYTMSDKVEGLVESSSNLGTIGIDNGTILMLAYPRSSSETEQDNMEAEFLEAADTYDFDLEKTGETPGWDVDNDSILVAYFQDAYTALSGEELSIDPVHAGLENGWFASKNPDLDSVSIGPTLENVHTVNETLYLDSLDYTIQLVVNVLGVIARE